MNFLGAFTCLADTGCTLESQLKAAISMEPGEMGEKGLEGLDKDTLANSVFQLPISYLATIDPNLLNELPDVVARDLELSILADPSTTESSTKTTKSDQPEKNMYEHILQPKSKFARDILPAWKRHFTTDIPFLQQTQEVILTISAIVPSLDLLNPILEKEPEEEKKEESKENPIHEIWKDIKVNPDFLEKYGYLEWSMLAEWNHSAPFLQCMSVCNIMAPLMSFFIPIFILVVPFVLLKIQGVPISVSMYVECLTNIARNHFIGKAIMSFQNMTFQNAIYLFGSLALYLLQMYQNTMHCIRFYRNTQYMNESLLTIRKHVDDSIEKMDAFCNKYDNPRFDRYLAFCKDIQKHREYLGRLQEDLSSVCPFECSIFKTTEIGYMMKCFYDLRVNPEYEAAILYSMGFQGYLENLSALSAAFQKGDLGLATFDSEKEIVDINLDSDSFTDSEEDSDDEKLEVVKEDLGENAEMKKEDFDVAKEDLGEKKEEKDLEEKKEEKDLEEKKEKDLEEKKEEKDLEEKKEEKDLEEKKEKDLEEKKEKDLEEKKEKDLEEKKEEKKEIPKKKPKIPCLKSIVPKRYILEQAYVPHVFSKRSDNTHPEGEGSCNNPVKNDATLDKKIIITGPNASGKTTFLKTTAINLILSQQFGMGAFKSAHFKPYTHFHSYLNIPDTSGRDSLFQAESRRCKEILDVIKQSGSQAQKNVDHHFCIFDELYSGTNPKEATKSAYAFLKYLSETHEHVDFILTTHYVSICEKWNKKSDIIQNYKMCVLPLSSSDSDSSSSEGKYQFTYKIAPGISKIEGAIQILENMEYPDEMLETIRNTNFA